eukprot:5351062-Amphidinium_carterae.1
MIIPNSWQRDTAAVGHHDLDSNHWVSARIQPAPRTMALMFSPTWKASSSAAPSICVDVR